MADKPALLLIGPTPPPYHGVAVATRTLVESQLKQQFALIHLDISDRRGIHHVNHPDLYDLILFLQQWVQFVAVLVRRRPRLVYIPISQTTVGFLRDSLWVWPAALAGSRVVCHLHGGNFRGWYEQRGAVAKAYVRSVLRWVAHMIVLGESLQPLFHGLLPDSRVTVVPNGIEWAAGRLPDCDPTRKRRYRVLYVGTLNRRKGALVLLQAVPLIEAVRQDVEFLFAGLWSSAQDRADAEALMVRQDLHEAISFVGLIEGAQKLALFKSADLFVFPGLQQEGQPLVVIEAMAASLPVLFTDRGCLKETVAEAGLQVDIDDPQSLAERILWLFDHPCEMQRMGAAARRRYEEFYTKERFIGGVSRVLNQAVDEVF